MRLVFASNFLNHHQLPIAEILIKKYSVDYIFLATSPVPQERLELGYGDMNEEYSFVYKAYGDGINSYCEKLLLDCDVLIYGSIEQSAISKIIRKRIKGNKLTLLYSERIFRNGYHTLLSPRAWFYMCRDYLAFNKKQHYLLCAGAYVSYDLSLIGAFKNKMFKWGYFPANEDYNELDLFAQKGKEIPELLYTGRFLNWKHASDVIAAASLLKKRGIEFLLRLVGCGEKEIELKELVISEGVDSITIFEGAVPHDRVMMFMQRADIFFFPSDSREGWGAVLNEAMNCGCACIVSNSIGAAPYLIDNGVNGYLYNCGDIETIAQIAQTLIEDSEKRRKIGSAAQATIRMEWNPEKATDNLMKLIFSLRERRPAEILHGPCSPAPICKNKVTIRN